MTALNRSKVYFAPLSPGDSVQRQAELAAALYAAAGQGVVAEGDLTALKTHFGEEGNKGFVKPPCLKALADRVKAAGGKPFLTDSNTLYRGRRSNAVDHLELIHEHGFTLEAVGAPVLIGDGLIGRNEFEVEIGGKHYQKVSQAADIVSCHAMVVISHATGHMVSGFGGAVKNIGMGCASRKGKMKQHSDIKPNVKQETCTACGTCLKWCPADAIELKPKALIDEATCIGCGECLTVCAYGAVKFSWGETSQVMQEKMAEHALGAVKGKEGKLLCLTWLNHLTKDCDCMATPEEGPILPDVGLVASTDPVAVDQAAIDLIREKAGEDLAKKAYPELDAGYQLAHAEAIGLGTRKYELVEL